MVEDGKFNPRDKKFWPPETEKWPTIEELRATERRQRLESDSDPEDSILVHRCPGCFLCQLNPRTSWIFNRRLK